MDMGIAGRKALVCGASAGLGLACASALAREGVELVIAARTEAPLREAAAQLTGLTKAPVHWIAADVTTEAGRTRILADHPAFDILVTNAGGPPPGDFRQWEREHWLAALDANMLAPIALIRATVDKMGARGFGRVVNITSAAVKAPIAELGLSNGARAGLTGFVAGAARQVAGTGVTINTLLPGRFATDRLRSNFAANAKRRGLSEAEIERAAIAAVPAGRLGDPAEFGQYCAFLCSRQAGYITGQNLLIDGGSFPGTM
jgi:3-oxoacyl-[acyl-carrier protein] reductase